MARKYNSKGFTLAELLMGLMITSIISLAVATLAFALGNISNTTADVNEKQAQLRTATLRISELIAQSKLICSSFSSGIAIWRSDDNGDNKINPGELVYLERPMGANGINIELLVESFDLDDCGNFAMVIDLKDLDHALGVLEQLKPTIDAKAISYTPDVVVITVFAPHLREKPRIHGLMFSSMASMGISSLAISTSLSSVSCVVEGQHLDTTIRALTEAFCVPGEVKERPKDY